MNAGFVRKHACLSFVFIVSIGMMFVAYGNSYAQGSKKVGQLNFLLPDDWPVEKRGGLVAPIPTEEYVSIKFKEIEKEFQTIRGDLSEKFQGLESGLKNIEKDLLEEMEALRSKNEEEGLGRNLTDILSSIETLKGELDRLDRKMTKKIKDMQVKLEEIDPEIEFIKENLDGLQTQIYRLDEKIDYFHED
ncbi:MAG: hypothetical protein KAR32_00375 [Candidatus Omnitrophica bacterium]|nr:hypothetical protein [Candidatus Omnitrophota bacterium]